MGVFVNDGAADALLGYVSANSTLMILCQNQPATFTAAITPSTGSASTNCKLGQSTFSATNFTGPTTASPDGRKLVTDQVTGLSITVTSTLADHVAIVSSTTASLLLLVTTISNSQAVTTGNTATINSFTHRVADATT